MGRLLEIAVDGQFLQCINRRIHYSSIAHVTQSRAHIRRCLFKIAHIVGEQLRNVCIFRITNSTIPHSELTAAFCDELRTRGTTERHTSPMKGTCWQPNCEKQTAKPNATTPCATPCPPPPANSTVAEYCHQSACTTAAVPLAANGSPRKAPRFQSPQC